ncbi:hypothetical protein [Peribacillus frigoritolerans]|uniref:hypothetical protein n=1 Tax=Peribacillus frigoritolerans TaxID=450367 RepID=UPI0022823EAC|nr:hypothetical protein [Peribacillus frigoritolerans]MCY9007124.1 hypothetical protein [Peribacillus frigoritolerans]
MDSKEVFKVIQDNAKGLERMRNSSGIFKEAFEPSKLFESVKMAELAPPQIDTSYTQSLLDSIQQSKAEAQQREAEEQQREAEYKESVLSSLQGIEKNTALLTEMTSLLQTSNEKQDELFKLMVEILEIMKSKDQKEADTKFTAVTKKITAFADNANTLHSLINMAGTVYGSLPF